MTRRTIALVATTLALTLGVAACGDDEPSADATAEAITDAPPATSPPPSPPAATTPPPPPPPPDAGLPGELAGYTDGLRLNRAPIPPSSAPHAETKNVYVNKTRDEIAPGGTQRLPYPDGSIIVKSGSRGGDDAAIVAVMKKVAGGDPDHGDWEYVEYSRASADEPYSVLAEGAVCWSCHVQVDDDDWVFTKLE